MIYSKVMNTKKRSVSITNVKTSCWKNPLPRTNPTIPTLLVSDIYVFMVFLEYIGSIFIFDSNLGITVSDLAFHVKDAL
jgi:hypothetical protein